MKRVAGTVLATWIMAATISGAKAQIADYPTLERVLFVEQCVREHPDRSRQEMIYKCACAMDALAEEIPYAQYSDLLTMAQSVTIAGERGNTARAEESLKEARRFRGILAGAYKSCLIAQ